MTRSVKTSKWIPNQIPDPCVGLRLVRLIWSRFIPQIVTKNGLAFQLPESDGFSLITF